MSVRQGTTPTHRFEIPIEADLIEKIRIIYAQDEKVILTKETEECEIAGYIIETTLTQEETLQFNEHCHIQVQIHILTKRGEAFASDIKTIACGLLLGKRVLE